MSSESNKQLIEDTWGAIGKGDLDTFWNNLDDDVTWTFFGSHRFAGTFKGKQDLEQRLFAPLHDVLDGGITVNVNALYGDGDVVIMEAKGKAHSKTGLDYNNDYCLVITIENNKIRHVREYLDSELVTAVFGK